MNRVVLTQLEWVYTPEDYFHRPLAISCEAGNIVIENGFVKVEIDPLALKDDQLIVEKLYDQVKNLFREEQEKSQIPYELSMPYKVSIEQDGRRIVSYA
jgi:hypothetical protein